MTKGHNNFCVFALLGLAAVPAPAQIGSFEGSSFPDEDGWVRDGTLDCDRWITDDGWFAQDIDAGNHSGLPLDGENDLYRKSIAEFAGVDRFFVEWRVITDGHQNGIEFATPVVMAISGNAASVYHYTIASDRVRVIRDNDLPYVYVDIVPGVHTYRLELSGTDSYRWFIDNVMYDSGVPEGPYPEPTSRLAIRAKYYTTQFLTEWDYIRYGIPGVAGSLDVTGNGLVDHDDYYYWRDYMSLSGPNIPNAIGWSSCDADFDGDIDLADFASFQNLFTGP